MPNQQSCKQDLSRYLLLILQRNPVHIHEEFLGRKMRMSPKCGAHSGLSQSPPQNPSQHLEWVVLGSGMLILSRKSHHSPRRHHFPRPPDLPKMAGTGTASYTPLICIHDSNVGPKMGNQSSLNHYKMYLSHLGDVLL